MITHSAGYPSGYSSLTAYFWPQKYPHIPLSDQIHPFLLEGESSAFKVMIIGISTFYKILQLEWLENDIKILSVWHLSSF